MGRYLINRIILILPTLLLVMLASFAISRFIPGDKAESMMALQGINPDSPVADKEYKRLYTELGLDLPTFYFSIVPEFYPDNANAIHNLKWKNQIRELLQQKCRYDDIQKFLTAKETLVSELKGSSDSLTDKLLNTVMYEPNVAALNTFVENYKNTTALTSLASWPSYITGFEQMKSNIAGCYRPKWVWHGVKNQFHRWFSGAIMGDFGISIKDGRPALQKISAALGWTSVLVFLNILLTVLIAVPSGLLAGYRAGGAFDRWSGILWLALYSVPVFWLASMLIVFFTLETGTEWYRIFPVPGTWHTAEGAGLITFLFQNAGQLALPLICLVANDIAQLSRMVRNNVVNQIFRPYVLQAKSKGLSSGEVLIKHILPNALTPVITSIGGRIPASLSGALVVEIIFNIPGMGRLLYDSIRSADWNVVFGVVVVICLFTIVFLLITDMVYALVNPRIRLS